MNEPVTFPAPNCNMIATNAFPRQRFERLASAFWAAVIQFKDAVRIGFDFIRRGQSAAALARNDAGEQIGCRQRLGGCLSCFHSFVLAVA